VGKKEKFGREKSPRRGIANLAEGGEEDEVSGE